MAKKYKKKRNKAKVSFVGMSSEDVTGSSHLVEYGKKRLLMDFGTYQHHDKLKAYQVNNRNLNKIRPKQLSVIVISHYHL